MDSLCTHYKLQIGMKINLQFVIYNLQLRAFAPPREPDSHPQQQRQRYTPSDQPDPDRSAAWRAVGGRSNWRLFQRHRSWR
jgi:hypothetical protein